MGFKVFNFYGGALLRPVAKADSDLSENECCDTIEKKSAKYNFPMNNLQHRRVNQFVFGIVGM